MVVEEEAFQNLRQVTQLLPHLLTSAKIKAAVIFGSASGVGAGGAGRLGEEVVVVVVCVCVGGVQGSIHFNNPDVLRNLWVSRCWV